MGFLDRLLGREPQQPPTGRAPAGYGQQGYGPQDSTTGSTAADRQAIARYRYLLRTAPPEQVERAHTEAFSRLTPEQRQQVLQEMTQTLPAHERPQSADPQQLARAATRAEVAQPGYLQRTFGGRGMAGGMGGMGGSFAGSMLGSIAGVVIGTSVANMLLGGFDGSPEASDAGGGADGSGGSGGDGGSASDSGGTDGGGGGDFGGGDFGGGDF